MPHGQQTADVDPNAVRGQPSMKQPRPMSEADDQAHKQHAETNAFVERCRAEHEHVVNEINALESALSALRSRAQMLQAALDVWAREHDDEAF